MKNPICYHHAATCRFNSGDNFTLFAAQNNNPLAYAVGGCTFAQILNPVSNDWIDATYRNNPPGPLVSELASYETEKPDFQSPYPDQIGNRFAPIRA